MKRIIRNSFIALSTVLAVGLTACTEEVDYMPAEQVDANLPAASFTTYGGDFWELAPSDEKRFTLTVMREDPSGSTTVPLIVEQNDGNVFQVPENVTFADGQNEATIEITCPDLEIGVVYNYCIRLDVDPYRDDLIALTNGSVQMIQWDLLGIGSLTCSAIYADIVEAPCNIYKASHADWYKAEDPLEQGMSIVFKVAEDNSVVVEDQPIITHPSYGPVYVNNDTGGGVYDPATNTIQAALYYYCSAGYFGTYIETLTLPSAE